MRVSSKTMRFLFGALMLFFVAACAGETDNPPPNPAQTKADTKARDEFARTLPKPPER